MSRKPPGAAGRPAPRPIHPVVQRIGALYLPRYRSARAFSRPLAQAAQRLLPGLTGSRAYLYRDKYWEGRISAWNNGEGEVTADHLRVIAAVLGVPVDALLSDEPPSPPSPQPAPVTPQPPTPPPALALPDWRADLLDAVAGFTRAANRVQNTADRFEALEAGLRAGKAPEPPGPPTHEFLPGPNPTGEQADAEQSRKDAERRKGRGKRPPNHGAG